MLNRKSPNFPIIGKDDILLVDSIKLRLRCAVIGYLGKIGNNARAISYPFHYRCFGNGVVSRGRNYCQTEFFKHYLIAWKCLYLVKFWFWNILRTINYTYLLLYIYLCCCFNVFFSLKCECVFLGYTHDIDQCCHKLAPLSRKVSPLSPSSTGLIVNTYHSRYVGEESLTKPSFCHWKQRTFRFFNCLLFFKTRYLNPSSIALKRHYTAQATWNLIPIMHLCIKKCMCILIFIDVNKSSLLSHK